MDAKLTWLEVFYKYKILPYSLGRLKHTPETADDPYYKSINNIVNSVNVKPEKTDLKKFLEGGIL